MALKFIFVYAKRHILGGRNSDQRGAKALEQGARSFIGSNISGNQNVDIHSNTPTGAMFPSLFPRLLAPSAHRCSRTSHSEGGFSQHRMEPLA